MAMDERKQRVFQIGVLHAVNGAVRPNDVSLFVTLIVFIDQFLCMDHFHRLFCPPSVHPHGPPLVRVSFIHNHMFLILRHGRLFCKSRHIIPANTGRTVISEKPAFTLHLRLYTS